MEMKAFPVFFDSSERESASVSGHGAEQDHSSGA
jgi:hypothetical protein